MVGIWFLGAIILRLFIRFLPRLGIKMYGSDTWFFLLIARMLRNGKNLTTETPFILDKMTGTRFDYPLGFPRFLSLFPESFTKKWNALINPFLDIMEIVPYAFLFPNWKLILPTILFSLVDFQSAQENTNLNARVFGRVLFAFTFIFLWKLVFRNDVLWLLLASVSGALVLLSHKMSTQALFITWIIALCWNFSWELFLFPAITIILALVFSKGYYITLAKGHRDFLLYYWRVRDFDWATQKVRLKRNLAKELLKNAFLRSPVLSLSIMTLFWHFPLDPFWRSWAIFLIVFWLLPDLFYIPLLSFEKEGYRYLEYSSFPAGVFLTYQLISSFFPSALLILGILYLGVSLILQILYLRKSILSDRGGLISQGLIHLADQIAASPFHAVACFPSYLSSFIAYWTGKSVLDSKSLTSLVKLMAGPSPFSLDRLHIFKSQSGVDSVLVDLKLYPGSYDNIVFWEGDYVFFEPK